ncbi:MAG TPA: SDR family NAD(P)-dependent oxidoreductase [Thermoanaerobaculia bacterium]|jgi:NAD(P)-dependent dehydrogenase (short-subunit alcohol dehydrogenase family)
MPASSGRLSGKVAFVTGASRGLGEAIARRFGEEGARVVLAARDAAACERHAAAMRARGQEALAVSCDVVDRESVASAIAAAVKRFGRIDVLVNNAGAGGPTPLDDPNPDDSRWDTILATNLTGAFRVTKAAAPHLSEGGRVLNMSSVLGRFGVAGHSAYAAAKHGVIGLTRSLALELAPRGITVNAMCPGWVETEMAREGFRRMGSEEEGRAKAARMAPLGRVLEPTEVASLAVYLASDEARSVTGQAIVIDGGQVMP